LQFLIKKVKFEEGFVGETAVFTNDFCFYSVYIKKV